MLINVLQKTNSTEYKGLNMLNNKSYRDSSKRSGIDTKNVIQTPLKTIKNVDF